MPDQLYEETISEEHREAASYRRTLARQVRRVLGGAPSGRRIVRVEQPVKPVDLFGWLRAQSQAPKGYWAGREGSTATAMVGAADVCSGPPRVLEAVQTRLAAGDAAVRYYGGLRFDADRAAEGAWATFGPAQFVLPRFELRTAEGREATLACNLVLPRDADRGEAIRAQIERLAFPMEQEATSLPALAARADVPPGDAWQQAVREALDGIREGALEKVVLARKVVLDFSDPVDPLVLLERLQAATPGCFHFCLQPAGPASGEAFVGASPERLFRREGDVLWSEAIAGTRPRGASEAADARLRTELLESDKDRREHAFVLRSIRERLETFSTTVKEDGAAEAMTLARGQHIRVPLRARLRREVTAAELLRALHPTPAVGGTPTGAALRAIRQMEPFDRGWYAGPVGWIGDRAAEFAVGIRSGLVQGRRLALFSGAGIVEGSVPAAEWAEVEQKIADFLQVLF